MGTQESQFNTHPQPRTFAPSKEDVLQNLQYFFGAPVSPEKLKDYSEHRAHSRHSNHRASPWFAITERPTRARAQMRSRTTSPMPTSARTPVRKASSALLLC